MLYLILAIISSAMVSICMRLAGGKTSGEVGMLAVNYLTCMLVAGLHTGFGNLIVTISGFEKMIGMSLFNGLLYLLGFILLKLNIRRNGVVLSAIFMKLGLLVPMAVSVVLFRELPDLLQLCGFVIALVAIVFINFEKEQNKVSFKAGLILLLLAGGGGDAMSKVFEGYGDPALSEQFLFYTFLSAFVLCVALMLYKKETIGGKEIGYGLLIGIPNYYSARFLLLAVERVPAVIVYPTVSVATIVVISLAGVCFFKEQLGKKQWIAIAMIVIALVLLNL